jgi:hypothetical protein
MIQIHQFSTGIKADRDAQGNWFSRGFTGQYMNSTLPVIPEIVQRSIRNKEFAVAEGAYSREPAIVARVVPSEGEPSWSVVATVTQGRDEYERPFSAYRYFLGEGEDLWQLLAWLESLPQVPVFSPFEAIETYSFAPLPPPYIELSSWRNWLEQEGVPAILKPGHLAAGKPQYLQTMNQLAAAKSGGQPIAWAYNVEALEMPRRFALVQVASEKAEEMLRRSLLNAPTMAAPVADDQAIKSAVKSLTNSSQMKPEVIQTIATAMGNPKVTAEYWKEIFDGQGATKAIKQKLFSPQVVRLLTLRAIILPTTLPEFLTWLNPQLNAKKQSEHCETSLEFQSGLYQQFSKGGLPQLDQILKDGVEALLLQVLKSKVAIEAAVWAVVAQGSIWRKHNLVHFVAQDLVSMSPIHNRKKVQSASQVKFIYGDELWKSLKNWWSSRGGYGLAAYEPLALFFGTFAEATSAIEPAKVAAYFYQVSQGQVPDAIFGLAFPGRRWNSNAYGLEVAKEVTLVERAWLMLLTYGGYLLIPLLIVGLGILVADLLKDVKGAWNPFYQEVVQSPPDENLPPPNPADSAKDVSAFLLGVKAKPDENISAMLSSAKEKFYGEKGTCFQIRQIVDEFSKGKFGPISEPKVVNNEVVRVLKLDEKTDSPLFSRENCSKNQDKDKSIEDEKLAERWSSGIYIYQRREPVLTPDADGVISETGQGQTSKTLQCKIAEELHIKRLLDENNADFKSLCLKSAGVETQTPLNSTQEPQTSPGQTDERNTPPVITPPEPPNQGN